MSNLVFYFRLGLFLYSLVTYASMEMKVISSGTRYSALPGSYVRPESERPRLSEVSTCDSVPVIDLGCQNRAHVVDQIRYACIYYGFFQVPYYMPKYVIRPLLH